MSNTKRKIINVFIINILVILIIYCTMDVQNTNILSFETLPSPVEVKEQIPIPNNTIEFVIESRNTLKEILLKQKKRYILIVGPCSIHDEKSAIEYASKLSDLKKTVADKFFMIMRVYFEKPRTTIGWKGFINDPYLDKSFKIKDGILKARDLMLRINSLGLPVATEALDPILPQYFDDLVTWSAIGARTVESQTHREMASGLSTPVGFKNATNGSLQPAINALKTVNSPHHFFGIDSSGHCCACFTRGNPFSHIVLRGGECPNYDKKSIKLCEIELTKHNLPLNIVVDCSHGNSHKKFEYQKVVFNDCIEQIIQGNTSIIGLMLESHLFEGAQDFKPSHELKYGISITDPCIGWQETEKIITEAYKKLS